MNAPTRRPFSYLDCLRRADEILAAAPSKPHIERAPGRGSLVKRFALPLTICPTLNSLAEMQPWRRAKLKRLVGGLMLIQNARKRQPKPLEGRPQLRSVRFSSRASDDDAAFMKFPVDRLTIKNGGLGYIVDDSREAISRVSWWEPCKQGEGFVLIEIYTGES